MQCMYFIIDWNDIDIFRSICFLFSFLQSLKTASKFCTLFQFLGAHINFRRISAYCPVDCRFVVVSFTFCSLLFACLLKQNCQCFCLTFQLFINHRFLLTVLLKFTEIWFFFRIYTHNRKSPIYVYLFNNSFSSSSSSYLLVFFSCLGWEGNSIFFSMQSKQILVNSLHNTVQNRWYFENECFLFLPINFFRWYT